MGLEPAGSDLDSFLMIMVFSMKILIFPMKILIFCKKSQIFLYEKCSWFSLWFYTIHEISYYKVRLSTGSVETRWLGGSFEMVYRNNADRLGSDFMRLVVFWETRCLGHLGGFYVPERPCIKEYGKYIKKKISEYVNIEN